jgi:regulator of protease activity HflC (stomatin/prohibitin superfamily)
MTWALPVLSIVLMVYLWFTSSPYLVYSIILFIILVTGIRIIYQYEQALKFRLGKFVRLHGPGFNYIIPVVEKLVKLDMRIITVDIPKQEVMTKDNVPVQINGVVYFKVRDPKAAILEIQDFHFAISQYSLAALRDVVGNENLDDVLTQRERVAKEIEKILDQETDNWGLDVTSIKLQDIELPEKMKRVMARQAEAEREKRANIIKAEGEVIASDNLQKAAEKLSRSPGALHLRTLQTINDVSPDQSNTIIFAVPLEIVKAFESVGGLVNRLRRKA